MLKFCVMVTGSTGSGKSSIVDDLAMQGWATLHTGDIVRKMMKESDKGGDAIAPSRLDHEVYKQFIRVVHNASLHNMNIAMECIPRNEAQLGWIHQAEQAGYIVVVIRTVAFIDVRRNRVNIRDASTPERWELDQKKMDAEGDDFGSCSYFTRLLSATPHRVVNTSVPYSPATPHTMVSVDSMMSMAVGIHSKRSGAGEISVGKMMGRCIAELAEAEDAVNADGDNPYTDSFKEELVDALFFLLVAMSGSGMTAYDVFNLFAQKYRINVHRHDNGVKPYVSKLNKE